MKIAYFGTGMLGAGYVRHQLELGTTVHVWNRTPDKAKALVADGAVFFDDAAKAVAGVDQIHITLSDDASVDAVLEPIADAIAASTYIIDHTTTAPTPTVERVARWKARGKHFVHAPVFQNPEMTRKAGGMMLTSCTPAELDAIKPMLDTMTGTLTYLGDDPKLAASYKLFGNLLIVSMTAGLADVRRLAGSLDIATSDALGFFNTFNPGAALPVRSNKIATADFSASWELTMARKDVRLMNEEANRHDVTLGIMPAIGAMFDAAIAQGNGALDITAVAKLDGRVSPSS